MVKKLLTVTVSDLFLGLVPVSVVQTGDVVRSLVVRPLVTTLTPKRHVGVPARVARAWYSVFWGRHRAASIHYNSNSIDRLKNK